MALEEILCDTNGDLERSSFPPSVSHSPSTNEMGSGASVRETSGAGHVSRTGVRLEYVRLGTNERWG